MSRLATGRIPAARPFKINAFSAPSLYVTRTFIGCLVSFHVLSIAELFEILGAAEAG